MSASESPISPSEFEQLRQIALEALSRATIGDFGARLAIPADVTPELKEIIVGIQVLIDTAHDQAAEIARLKKELSRTTVRTAGVLEELLRKSLPSDTSRY